MSISGRTCGILAIQSHKHRCNHNQIYSNRNRILNKLYFETKKVDDQENNVKISKKKNTLQQHGNHLTFWAIRTAILMSGFVLLSNCYLVVRSSQVTKKVLNTLYSILGVVLLIIIIYLETLINAKLHYCRPLRKLIPSIFHET